MLSVLREIGGGGVGGRGKRIWEEVLSGSGAGWGWGSGAALEGAASEVRNLHFVRITRSQ